MGNYKRYVFTILLLLLTIGASLFTASKIDAQFDQHSEAAIYSFFNNPDLQVTYTPSEHRILADNHISYSVKIKNHSNNPIENISIEFILQDSIKDISFNKGDCITSSSTCYISSLQPNQEATLIIEAYIPETQTDDLRSEILITYATSDNTVKSVQIMSIVDVVPILAVAGHSMTTVIAASLIMSAVSVFGGAVLAYRRFDFVKNYPTVA